MTVGNIHSIETMGTVDGPGLRFVVFMQGCPMRCQYCHNPDSWNLKDNHIRSVEDIFEQFYRKKEFYKSGGITVTGGEPLLQIDFVIELFKLCHKHEIHTCLDTSGITFTKDNPKFLELIKYTDLFLLDIKHIDNLKHRKITGCSNSAILEFARFLDEHQQEMWIRHVVVEGLSDDENDLEKLGEFIGSLNMVKALDVLPYHSMGEVKYQALGIDYPLKGMKDLSLKKAQEAKQKIMSGIIEYRKTRT